MQKHIYMGGLHLICCKDFKRRAKRQLNNEYGLLGKKDFLKGNKA